MVAGPLVAIGFAIGLLAAPTAALVTYMENGKAWQCIAAGLAALATCTLLGGMAGYLWNL